MKTDSIIHEMILEIEEFSSSISSHPLMKRAFRGYFGYEAVAAYISNIEYMLRHTPKHLELAIGLAEQFRNRKLAEFYRKKLAEERGHDAWARADLQTMENLFGVRATTPSPPIARMMCYVRERIEVDPSNYLAYILFAEYLVVRSGPDWVRALQMFCGIPSRALSCITRHIELDVDHVEAGRIEIERLTSEISKPVQLLTSLQGAMGAFREFVDYMDDFAARFAFLAKKTGVESDRRPVAS